MRMGPRFLTVVSMGVFLGETGTGMGSLSKIADPLQ